MASPRLRMFLRQLGLQVERRRKLKETTAPLLAALKTPAITVAGLSGTVGTDGELFLIRRLSVNLPSLLLRLVFSQGGKKTVHPNQMNDFRNQRINRTLNCNDRTFIRPCLIISHADFRLFYSHFGGSISKCTN